MLDASTIRPAEPGSCSDRQPGGGAGVVVGDVARDVAEVDAQADPGRLVAHRVDAPGAPPPRARGRARRPGELGAGSAATAGGRPPWATSESSTTTSWPRGEQQVDDVGADEAGAAGDEDPHVP